MIIQLNTTTVRSLVLAVTVSMATTTGWARQTDYTHNDFGQVLTVDGPRNDVQDITTYTYNPNTADMLTMTNAVGHVTEYTNYTQGGLAQTIITPNGAQIDLVYNWRGQVTKQTVTAGTQVLITDYQYDKVGQLETITQPTGASLTYKYDNAQRLIGLENNNGERMDYTLDSAGNITAQTIHDPTNTLTRQHTQVFDDLNRLQQHIGGTEKLIDGVATPAVTELDYSVTQRTQSVTDPKKNPDTVSTFDPLNRLSTVVDSKQGKTQFTYNAKNGLIETVTDPRGLVTRYDYNGYGELKTITSPDTGVTRFEHDDAGNVTQRTRADGTVVSFTYDALNRLTEQRYPATPDKNVLFTYDDIAPISINGIKNYGLGQLTGLTYHGGQIEYQYDQLGRLVAEQRSMGGQAYVTEYRFNEVGQLKQFVYPSGRVLTYSYDTQGRLKGLTTKADAGAAIQTIVSDLTYLPFGPVKTFGYGNGLNQTYDYDLDYRLEGITSSVQNWIYNYDLNSNIETITHSDDATKNQTYGYDELNRLTSASGPYGDYGYKYDAVGNRLERQRNELLETLTYSETSNQLDQLLLTSNGTALDTRKFTYTESGQLKTDNAFKSKTFEYDENDRLKKVAVQDGPEQITGSYQYNPLGQRIAQETVKSLAPGPVSELIYIHYNAQGQRIAESDFNGNVIREYIYLGQTPIAMVVNDQLYFVHTDHLATPKILTDVTGNKVWEQHTTPFGEVHETIASGIENIQAFPGQYRDGDTGLSYNYFRDYDPSLGRYVQSDPIGLGGGLNTYGYVKANPILYFDPNGLRCWTSTDGYPTCDGKGGLGDNNHGYERWNSGDNSAFSDSRFTDNGTMRACPSSPPINDSNWVKYWGNPNVFHCGYDGYLENKYPQMNAPMNECFYDHSGTLVDSSHEYSACGGSPDYFGSDKKWEHTFDDPGGVCALGVPAGLESLRYWLGLSRGYNIAP